jgi:YidC/Oxa1 family membrane protein insertase
LDKRLLIVLPVCLVIILGWSLVSERMGWTHRARPVPPGAIAAPLASPTSSTSAGQETTTRSTAAHDTKAESKSSAPLVGPRVTDDAEREITLSVGHLRAVLTNRGAALEELRTSRFFDRAGLSAEEKARVEHWEPLLLPLETNGTKLASMLVRTSPSSADLEREPLERELWTMHPLGPDTAPTGVEFQLTPGTGVTFTKRYTILPDAESVRFEFEIKNDALAGQSGPREFVLTPAVGVPAESGDRTYPEPRVIAASRPHPEETAQSKVIQRDDRNGEAEGAFTLPTPLSFVGVYNKYFAALIHAADDTTKLTLIGASWRRLRDDAWAKQNPTEADRARRQIVAEVQLQLALPDLGQSHRYAFDLYAGSKDRTQLERSWPDHSAVLNEDLGVFNPISSVLLVVLHAYRWLTGNWGIAIILLTLTVRGCLFPINRSSQTAMARYQTKQKRLQPKIDEIKKKYEEDSARQRQEQAKLMQQEGLFPPLGGCLPMFVQIPIFFGLYRALGVSFDLRQASFLAWIKDLSLPDRLLEINLNTHLPFIGTIQYLNILPPVMVALWIWQQRGMPLPADEQAARMQKMMMWMPVMMGFFLYNYAAGLSLYMITQSGLGVIEQKVIKKYWPVDDREKPVKKNGFMSRLMEAQGQQMKKTAAQKRQAARAPKR